MGWNDDFYDKSGNHLSTSDGDQEVFDRDGRSLGYLDGSVVYDNNSNRLGGRADDDPPSKPTPRAKIFGIF